MGMCSNVKKSQKNEIENSKNIEKNNSEKAKSERIIIPTEEEFKDMEEWEGKFLIIKKGEKYSGVGIKCIKGYKCEMLIDDLLKLRDKFWSIFFRLKLKF